MVQSSSWVDLWDRASEFIKYHDNGINIHERLYKFLIEFAKLQKEAFIAQKRLCEKHLNDAQKYFGVSNSYVSFFNELVQIVQHIIDAENLISCSFEIHASNEGKSVIEDERRQFKRWKRERSKLSSELKSQTRIIDDEIKRYRDKYRDMIKAKDDYERINADQSHSQFDVEKALSYARLKEVDFERARKDYSAALDQFNLYRKDYYFRCLPLWAQVGKDLETVRYTRTQSLISILYERLRVAIDRMTTVCSEFQAVSTHLNSDQDAEEIINFLRSNNAPPGDIDFVDLSSASLPSSSGPQTSTTSTNNVKSNIGLSSEPIYSSGSVVLPPNFHCSVWAADHAGAGGGGGGSSINKQYNLPSGEAMIYGESGSTYSASYASTTASTTNGPTNGSLGGGSMNSRRPSASDHFAVPNPRHPSQQLYASNGAGFFRRIFSRRSRSVVNLKTIADLCDPNRVKRQGTFHQTNGEYNPMKPGGHKSRSRDNIVIDTSDFSDSCSDFENDEVHSQPIIQPPTEEVTPSTAIQMNSLPNNNNNNNENIAYATTSVLNGLPNSIPSQYPPSLSDITSLTSHHHHPSFDTQGITSSSGKDKLSIPLHYFAAMAKTSVANDNNGNNNNTNGKYLKNEGKSCSSAPLAEPETASTVTSSTSSRPTSTSSSLNGQILPSVKQNLAAVKSNNNTKYHSVNGNAAYNCVNDSNHNDKDSTMAAGQTFMYSHMHSSYNHHHQQHSEGKIPHQILYDQHKSLLKRHEQQRLWLLQQEGGQQQQQQKEQSLQHQQQHQHRSSRAPDNSDTSSTLSVSYHSNSSSSNNNNNNRDKNSSGKESSQIVVIGDCTALYSFTADGFESCYLAFEANDKFYILSSDPTEDTTDWLHVCRMQQQQQHPFEIGYVPTAYVQQQLYSQPILLPNNNNHTKHEPTQDSSDSSSTTKTTTTATATPKRPATTIPISTTHNGQIKSSGSNNNSTVSNRSNMNHCMMNRNFRGTSPYVRLSGVSRDTDL